MHLISTQSLTRLKKLKLCTLNLKSYKLFVMGWVFFKEMAHGLRQQNRFGGRFNLRSKFNYLENIAVIVRLLYLEVLMRICYLFWRNLFWYIYMSINEKVLSNRFLEWVYIYLKVVKILIIWKLIYKLRLIIANLFFRS